MDELYENYEKSTCTRRSNTNTKRPSRPSCTKVLLPPFPSKATIDGQQMWKISLYTVTTNPIQLKAMCGKEDEILQLTIDLPDVVINIVSKSLRHRRDTSMLFVDCMHLNIIGGHVVILDFAHRR